MQEHLGAFRQGLAAVGGHGFHQNETMMVSFFCEHFHVHNQAFAQVSDCSQEACDTSDQGCWERRMTQTELYFRVRPDHYRRDSFAPSCAGKTLKAEWNRRTLLRRYLPQLGERLPDQVPVNTTQTYIDTVSSVLQQDGGVFDVTNTEQLRSIQSAIASVDWDNVIIHAYAVPPDPASGGLSYSPAFNAIYVVWDKSTHDLSHYMIVAANADGDAQTRYIGIDFGTVYESQTNYLFTPLTGSLDNPLYFSLPRFDPLNMQESWLFNIEIWYAQHAPPAPSYIQVNTSMTCTESPTQPAVVEQVAAKEYYMTKLIEAYLGSSGIRTRAAARMTAASWALWRSLLPWENLDACAPVADEYRALLEPTMGDLHDPDALPWQIEPECR